MRGRKNKETIIRQYKYSVSTDLRPIPAEVWDIARRMQAAWNALIPAYAGSGLALLNRDYAVAWEAMKTGGDGAAYKTRKKELDAKKRETWLAWDKQARAAIKPFGLDYSQGPNVIERFNGCIKAGRTCAVETEITACQIPFCFPGSAAIPVSALYNNTRRWRIVLEGVSDGMFERNDQVSRRERRMCYLELGISRDVAIPLRIDFHRPLPVGGKVKRVLLCGRKIPFRGIRWHVLFQVEQPISQTVPQTKRTVSLRIGWTKTADHIVVAQWRDDAGEGGVLGLPLALNNCQDRRTAKRRPGWTDWLMNYADLPSHRTAEYSLPEHSVERMKMRERRRRVEERWQARRAWLYRNFAAWLVEEYAMIRLPDLDIKAIGRADKRGALAGADRWRQVAAPGDLLAAIKDIASKHGRTVENYAQASMEFEVFAGQSGGLRKLAAERHVQVFDVAWNSRAVAGSVHAG